MTDLTTMETRIANEVDDSGIAAEITAAINTAIKFYERKPFYFNQSTFTFPTVATRANYGAADAASIANLLRIDSMYVTDSSVRHQIYPAEYQLIDAAQNALITGPYPTNYAYYGLEIWFLPTPTLVNTVTVSATIRFATITLPTGSNAWFTDAEELIRQRAKRILALDITKEPQDALAAQVLEDAALDALLYETQLRRGRPPLQIDPALTNAAPSNIRTGT